MLLENGNRFRRHLWLLPRSLRRIPSTRDKSFKHHPAGVVEIFQVVSNKPQKTSKYVASVSASKSMYRYYPDTCGCACQSPTMLLVGSQHQVRFGRYEMSVPSNPVASGLRAGWTATISLTCHVLRHTAVVWSVSPPSRLDERMRHASRPGWWSHNETDRGGATAPRKGSKHFNPD